jgi:hypothetical protein
MWICSHLLSKWWAYEFAERRCKQVQFCTVSPRDPYHRQFPLTDGMTATSASTSFSFSFCHTLRNTGRSARWKFLCMPCIVQVHLFSVLFLLISELAPVFRPGLRPGCAWEVHKVPRRI